jgi:multisubunit Na+/H+ antiporter MnhB subunit
MMLSAFDIGLAALVLALAGWTILTRGTFASVVGFVANGLLLALVWVRLSAVDVALTEAAIGSGVTGMLLIGVAARLRPTEASTVRAGDVSRGVAAVLSLLVTAGLAAIVLLPASPAPSLAPAASEWLPQLGVGNPVTAVLLAYRAFDTFMESVVLLLALLGVWSLAPDRFWGGAAELRYPAASGDLLAFLARLLIPFGIVVAIYIFWIGSDQPGGEFQASAILTAMWVLAMLAGLCRVLGVSERWLRLVLVVGPAVFLSVGLAGFAMAGGFLAYPPGYMKPLILLIEVPLALSIAAMLGLLLAGPPTRKRL